METNKKILKLIPLLSLPRVLSFSRIARIYARLFTCAYIVNTIKHVLTRGIILRHFDMWFRLSSWRDIHAKNLLGNIYKGFCTYEEVLSCMAIDTVATRTRKDNTILSNPNVVIRSEMPNYIYIWFTSQIVKADWPYRIVPYGTAPYPRTVPYIIRTKINQR